MLTKHALGQKRVFALDDPRVVTGFRKDNDQKTSDGLIERSWIRPVACRSLHCDVKRWSGSIRICETAGLLFG
jgi:hypothetical protein